MSTAIASPAPAPLNNNAWQDSFLPIAAVVGSYAKKHFRGNRNSDDLCQTAVCLALQAYRDLYLSGRGHYYGAKQIAYYAALQAGDGRAFGCKRSRDTIQPADVDCKQVAWLENIAGSDASNPAEIVPVKMDCAAWLASMSPKLRRLAEMLGAGASTTEAAIEFGVSLGRVSQIRRELSDSWDEFQAQANSL